MKRRMYVKTWVGILLLNVVMALYQFLNGNIWLSALNILAVMGLLTIALPPIMEENS